MVVEVDDPKNVSVFIDNQQVEVKPGNDGKTIVAIGDHRMRTMHSLGYALSQFDAEMVILAPEEMSPLPEFLAELDEK